MLLAIGIPALYVVYRVLRKPASGPQGVKEEQSYRGGLKGFVEVTKEIWDEHTKYREIAPIMEIHIVYRGFKASLGLSECGGIGECGSVNDRITWLCMVTASLILAGPAGQGM